MQRVLEEVVEVVRVRGAADIHLLSLRLERLLDGEGVVDGLQVERTLVTDGLEDGATLLGSNLLIAMEVYDESRDVVDHSANRSHVALLVLEHDTDLSTSDVT